MSEIKGRITFKDPQAPYDAIWIVCPCGQGVSVAVTVGGGIPGHVDCSSCSKPLGGQ